MNEIIWIDPDVESDENIEYLNELSQLENYKITRIKTISQAMDKFNEIVFEDPIIIVSGKLFNELVEELKKNINNICFIPNIIVFTGNKQAFLSSKDNKNINNSFYNSGGVVNDFGKVIQFIKNPRDYKTYIDRDDENQLSFDIIDSKEKLALPLLYKNLLEFNEKDNKDFIFHLYNYYYKKSKEIRKFLDSVKAVNEIPIQLLAKFYARIYTDDESKFYSDLNQDLRKNKSEKYLSFINVLYEGVRLKSLPLSTDKQLYRGTRLSNQEYQKMNSLFNESKEKGLQSKGLPGAIIFSRAFLSFSKDLQVAINFLINQTPGNTVSNFFGNIINTLYKVLFILEKEENLDENENYSLSTHADIGKLSLMADEREVLFFPFSSFEIIDINNKNEYITIHLRYLGKYLKDIENDQNLVNKKIDLPKSEFKEVFFNSDLIKKDKIENNNNTKDLIKTFKINKKIIQEIKSPNYQAYTKIDPVFNPIKPTVYPVYNKPYIIRRFTKKDTIKLTSSLPTPPHSPSRSPPRSPSSSIKVVFPSPPREEKKKKNCIIGKLRINKEDINKNIRIINSFEQSKQKYNYIRINNELKYRNEAEIKNNCEIKINGNKIPFSYFCIAKEPGDYTIEYNFKSYLTKTDFLFSECFNLIELDFWDFNSENVTNMVGMFLECSSLKTLKISNLDTKNVKDMNCMFYGCKELETLDLSGFNTQNVLIMSRLFFGCKKLKNINLSRFNTQNVIDMYNMFGECQSLLQLDLLNFYTQNVVNMSRMFFNCISLRKLNLSNFIASKIAYTNSMFLGCSSLTDVNLENFNLQNVINKEDMFIGCYNLKNIICKYRNHLF